MVKHGPNGKTKLMTVTNKRTNARRKKRPTCTKKICVHVKMKFNSIQLFYTLSLSLSSSLTFFINSRTLVAAFRKWKDSKAVQMILAGSFFCSVQDSMNWLCRRNGVRCEWESMQRKIGRQSLTLYLLSGFQANDARIVEDRAFVLDVLLGNKT